MTEQSAAAQEIRDHKLTWARWAPSMNHGGKLLRPTLLLTHYTGGVTLAGAVASLSDSHIWGPPEKPGGPRVKRKRRSAHLAIGRSGETVQLVEFNMVAWHAGESVWRGKDDVNLFSIGIELDNAGPLARDAREDHQWHSTLNPNFEYAPDQVILARHKSGGALRAWLRYTPEQLAALDRATAAIIAAYPSITEGAGHEDVSPGRKTDPGPAFPMKEWQAKHWPPPANV